MELRHAILGLLSLQPASGYDLGRAFKSSVAHFWHADQSQIYRTIDRLTADGAIETDVIRQDTLPDRKVHSLTDRGREELQTWLNSPLEAEKFKEPFLARLFFAESLGPDGVDRLLAERQEAATEVLENLQAIALPAEQEDLGLLLRGATLQYGITQAQAELAWLERTREAIKHRRTP